MRSSVQREYTPAGQNPGEGNAAVEYDYTAAEENEDLARLVEFLGLPRYQGATKRGRPHKNDLPGWSSSISAECPASTCSPELAGLAMDRTVVHAPPCTFP